MADASRKSGRLREWLSGFAADALVEVVVATGLLVILAAVVWRMVT